LNLFSFSQKIVDFIRLSLFTLAIVIISGGKTSPYSHLLADVEKGRYVFTAAGCQSCHTAGSSSPIGAGGVELKTPFGIFYTPNITPHPKQGIGNWSRDQFADAIRYGKNSVVGSFFPSFPYTAYTQMSDEDIISLYGYIMTLPISENRNQPHNIDFPFNWRFSSNFWRFMFFQPGPYKYDPLKTEEWNRGAYVVRAIGHCAECHSPRKLFGNIAKGQELSGNPKDYEGSLVPNITPDEKTGLGKWQESDIIALLKFGNLPDGDVVGGKMMEFVINSSSKLSNYDLQAIAIYLKSLPPIYNPAAPAKAPDF